MDHPMPEAATMIPTRMGQLHVRTCGSGRPAVLWHSLFVDSTTWNRVRESLASQRRLIMIDGPSHGRSSAVSRQFTLDECVGAAADVLPLLGIDEPVDWVGNAWGGHVGILFAVTHPQRSRSLITIGTPVHALETGERHRANALVALYRMTGPVAPLVKAVQDALLGPRSRVTDPDAARLVAEAWRRANRRGMYLAMRSAMLKRQDLTPLLSDITAPTLFVTGDRDSMWTPGDARAAAARLPDGACIVVPGGGHVAPLLGDGSALVRVVADHWDHAATRPRSPGR